MLCPVAPRTACGARAAAPSAGRRGHRAGPRRAEVLHVLPDRNRATAAHDDLRLLEAVKAGDAAALRTLYDRHAPVVFALCRRILVDGRDAEEALLDVFTQLWRRADSYDPERASPLAYMLTLARSRAIDRLRGRRRHERVLHAHVVEADVVAAAAPPDPFESADLAERRERIQRGLALLQAGQREAIELSFLRGLSHSEIASRLELPLGTVKTRIREGLIRLRDLVASETRSAARSREESG
jgi:RNA polymerase sigma-70 factor (ECF subfamily)